MYPLLGFSFLTVSAALYLFGHLYQKTPNPAFTEHASKEAARAAEETSPSGGGGGFGGGFANFFARKAVSAAAANPEAALRVAGAVAPSAGTLMFGGSREESSLKGFYDEDKAAPAAVYTPPEPSTKKSSPKAAAPAAAPAAATASFGAGSGKAAAYGLGSSADDVPEANPFMS